MTLGEKLKANIEYAEKQKRAKEDKLKRAKEQMEILEFDAFVRSLNNVRNRAILRIERGEPIVSVDGKGNTFRKFFQGKYSHSEQFIKEYGEFVDFFENEGISVQVTDSIDSDAKNFKFTID